MSAYSDSVFEPTFSEPAPISAKKYRNGSRNRFFRPFPSVFIPSDEVAPGGMSRCGGSAEVAACSARSDLGRRLFGYGLLIPSPDSEEMRRRRPPDCHGDDAAVVRGNPDS
jgi:hypothetical protein